ncbi:N-acetyl-gamma-glutamyl-phosphate reductase [Herbaspirillum seropedicae]|uniref:N-acetyl-gamma-glutamyl-phosphate reductase n=1 Tax=Herbaspirillum seropedicae (strain SmR1) TaxID=757424 RepID=D8IYV2_HERSS|nr:N-acetyl-gamma-glutamyl-phosphate reductase [Herbaspirillum seropedicae]ADJ64287.1 N-acetyl-gamma-glutamyl-phosphate reductase protein [Herbaspirillum seropedicae SmR1]AKN66235.1 N-acetyl-gamma-glutamyl-phosphate reductase [Herbaspirillum seropedicae]NQE30655.1 N-acetyl-gamma-glutamyl-phosphate reductase [Herbaspirillum seropedicae]UMU22227.1 N-acetyl-gamma-glutamyl-phosphate reductase [Herbaspirillum seropedicae]
MSTLPLIFIDGDQGTTGLQIHERLRARQDLRVLTLPAAERKDAQRRAEAINSADIALLCLPDAAAREAVAMISNPRVRVIDASSAHRTSPDWVYGFPEMAAGQAEAIATALRVSNPGCYPTGAIALLRPLVQAGLVPADYPLNIHAVSGYSGGGRAQVEQYEGAEAAHAAPFVTYGLGLQHKHPPEMQLHAGLSQRPLFVPSYGAFRQGIVLTIALQSRLLPAQASLERLRATLQAHYDGAHYVTVLDAAQSESTTQLDPTRHNHSNQMSLGVFGHAGHGHILLCAVFDNLGKGASGAAVQNLDLMLTR